MDMMEIIESSTDNKLNDGSNDDDDNNHQSMEQQTSNINQTSPCDDDDDDHMKQSDNIIDDDADDDTDEKSIPIESAIIDDDDCGNCEESITTTTATATTTLNDELIFLQEMNNPPNVRLSSSSMSSLQTLPIPMMKTTTIFLNSQHNDNNPFICESDDIDDQDDDNDQDNDGDQNDDNNDEDHMKFIDTNLDDLIMMDHDNNIDIGDTDNNNDDDDTDDETKTETSSFNNGQQMMNDDKKRLRLEDFMRQIITQINTSTEKIWPNLLLDFTKNFSELNIPTYVLQTSSSSTTLDDHCSSSSSFTKSDIDPSIVMMPTNSDNPSTNKMIQNNNRLVSNSDQDLLMDILNIAISSLTMEQTDRRIFACQLLLNIHDCLTMDTIETKLMPLLSELITNETTTSVRFTICFVLANYARRVEFDYFQSIIFPLFEKLSIIVLDNDNSSSSSSNQQQQNNNSLCTSTTICFALLDSLTSLLSYLLHFNQISMKKQQQQHCDNEQMPSEKEQPESNEQNTEKSTKNNVLEFIYQKFLPLLKQTFQRMLDFIDQYRSMSIKIEQDLFNCFLHWRDQIGSHDSITQTLFSHYQSLVLFILILRDYMMNNNDNHQCDNLNIDQRFLMEMFDHDHWYLDFYYRLCAFHYVLPPPPPLTPQSPSQLSSDNTLIDVSSSSSTTLIDQSTNSILTKINLMDLGKNNSNIQQQQQQNFIGRYQVTNVDGNMIKTLSSPSPSSLPLPLPLSTTTTTTSILQQHLQQQQSLNNETLSAYNSNYNNNDNNNIQTLTNSNITTTTIQNNNDFSIGSTQYTFTSNALNNLDIFGFFRYKTISCKIILVSLIPTISDLYDIGKQQQLQQQQSIKPLHNRQLRSRKSLRLKSGQPSRLPVSVVSSVQSSNKDEDITDSVDIESNSESPLSLEIERNNHDNKDNIATRLIDILNTLSIDNNYEIAMKMSNIIEKLVERFTEPIRLYSVLTNVLQSQNFDVIAQIIRNFVDVFTSMLNSSQLTAQTNTIIEYVVDTFMRSETYLSTKPKWRLHIQYFDVMFRLSRIIPVDIVKRLIIPRLLLRFSTTRPIPCRQAIARCLLMVYLENFAQHDFEKYCVQSTAVNNGANNQTTMMMISYPLNFDDHDHDQNAYLSFDLFNWLDRNLRQSQRYQDRQLYIDMLAMFIRFLFRDSIEWRESLPNHYLMDIEEQCPSLMNWSELSYRFSKYRYHLNLKELHSSQFFAMLMIQRYRLLHQLTELATKDRVSTIRTSSCIVLFTLLQCTNYWVINHLHQIPITVNDHCITKTNMIGTRNVSDIDNNDQSQLIEIIMDYYDAYMDNNGTIISEIESSANNYNSIGYCTSEQLEIRRQLEKDRIVLEELYKLYTLIDDIRLDLNLNYYQLRNKRKKPRKQQYNDEMISSSSPTPSITSIDSSVIELINELMLTVENDYLDQMNENNDDDDDVILEPLDKSSSEEDEGIDLNNDSSELIIDDLVVSESSTLSSSSIIETTAMETVNNSTESESTKCPGLIYVANVDELIVDSNETMDSKDNTSITEAGSETSAVVVINKKVVESSWSIQGNKSFNPNSLKCSTKKRKSPKHHEQQQQQSHMNHQRSVSNLALEKHLNTIIKHSDIISNIQQPSSIMMMAKTNSTNVNKSGYKGNYYHHHGINPGHNSGKVSSSASSKKKTSIINSQQRNNNNNNNGIALLPTPNNNNTVHCGSKVPILSNRNNNNNSHHHHMINNRVSLLQQQQQSSMVNNNNNNLTPNTANRNTSSSYPGFCYRIVYPTQTGQQQQSSTTTTTNSSAQFYNSGSTGTATTTTTAHHHLPLSSSLSSPGNINNNNNNGNLYQQQQHNYHHQKQNKIPSKLANSATIPFRTISFPQHHHHHPQAGLLHQPLQTKSSSSSLMILPKWHNHNSSNLSIYQHQRSMSVPPPSSSSSSNILLNSNHYPQNQNSTMLNVKKKLFKTTGSINPGVVGNVIIGNQSNIRNNHHHHYHHHHHHHYQSNILNTNIDQISSSSSSSSSKNNFIRVKKFKNRTNNEPLLLSSSSSTLKPGNKSMINKNESMETDDNCDDDHKNNNNNNNNKGQTSTIIVTTSTSESQPDSST